MHNRPSWQKNLEDPHVWPVEEINRIKEIYDAENLTRSHWDWNYQHQLANNTFSAKEAFDSVISILERAYYHDMLESDLISGFYKYTCSTDKLVATNTNPNEYLGGDLDRIPLNHLEPRSRGRDISLIATDDTHNGYIVNNPITERAQPEAFEDFYGRDVASKIGVTWFRYVWTWEFIDPLNREVFERTKLLNRWIDKKTFCHYHDIFQHTLLVYINGLPVNDFEVMFTQHTNVLKLPFDNKIFMDIQKGNPVPLTIYRIASKKQYWAQLNYVQMMEHEGKWDSTTWDDYADLFEDGNSDLVILNLCETKTMNNLAYREQQKTELMRGPQTIFLHLHKREDGSNYIDLHDIDPQVLSWWKSINTVTADIVRPKNMVEYTKDGTYPYTVGKDPFNDIADDPTRAYDSEYTPIDLTHEFDKDNGQFVGVDEEDFLMFKQYAKGSKPGRDQINDGWRPAFYKVTRTYPNTYRIDDGSRQNDIIEIRPYMDHYDALNDLNETKNIDPSLGVTQVQIPDTGTPNPYPELRIFYFTKTLYKDTILEPLMLQALKTARRYLFNPYRYTPPVVKNLPVGTEFTIREMGVIDEPYIILSHDTPIKGKTLCIRKYALPNQYVKNDYFDIYDEEFTTPVENSDTVSGDHYHLYGRYGVPSLQHFCVVDIPYYDAESNSIKYHHSRFFDASMSDLDGTDLFQKSPWFNALENRLCTLKEDPHTTVRWRLRDQSTVCMTYGKPHERPAYRYVNEMGVVCEDMRPDEKLYLRPCILIDSEFNFLEHDSDIHFDLPEELTPYPLTNWSDQELLKIITTNRQYFLKYFKLLFPGETFYGVEKYYKYSDENMANLMSITEHVPEYDVIGDGIVGAPTGDGTIVVDRESINAYDQNYWHVTKATIAHIPDKVDPHHTPKGWEKNYTINTHVMSDTGVELVVNMAKRHEFPTMQYKKSLTLVEGGSGYVKNDTLYIRNQSGDDFVAKVKEVDENGSIQSITATSWTDTILWETVSKVVGGHGTGVMFSVDQMDIPGTEEADYYPYVGMELHIEHDQVYDHDPSGTYIPTAVITGTGEGLLVNIEAEHIPYQKERDLDMWMYPFDYLTLKLKNFIYLHSDNFMDYLEKQYKSPFVDWSIRVFQDTDLAEYKRYHKGNFLTYNAPIDMNTPMNYIEFMMPPGYHAKLKDIKAYREYDVYASGNESVIYDGKEVPVLVYGKRLIQHPDDTGDILGSHLWRVTILNDDGEWEETTDPEIDIHNGFRMYHINGIICHMDPPQDGFRTEDVTACTVHLEFLTIRDSVHDDLWQEVTEVEEFDHPRFMVRFDNEHDTPISYRPFVGGSQKEFAERVHYEDSDYVYYDWGPVYQLKNSYLYKEPKHHKLYKLKDYKITSTVVTGLHFHPGMELHLTPVAPAPDYYDKVQILAIVDRVMPNPNNTVLELHIHDLQRVFMDYDPTGDWKVIPTDFQCANDKFHGGNGEQNSLDDWDRIHWFSDPDNKESVITPVVHLEGVFYDEQWIPAEKHYVAVNNTMTLRKLFHYDWEQEFTLDDDHPNGVTLNPDENPYNELHLEDLKIINTYTNELVPFDPGDGKELFTLQEIIPDVNRSIHFHTRYDLKQIRISESMLNMKQTLYDITDATTSLRHVTDIRKTFEITGVNINPNAAEYIECPIVISSIEPGNHTNCMDTYYVPEDIFRKQWNIPDEVKFDHRDYTLYQQPMVDTEGNVVMYADLDIRHTILPFNFKSISEIINDHTQPVLNNRPRPPIGPSHPDWDENMRYYPNTDEYVANYMSDGGISPVNIEGINWKPSRYDFPFQLYPNNITPFVLAKGTDTHAVENNYIRIKHIYNIHPADGVETVPCSRTVPSPSSRYNNHSPEAYTMGDLMNPMQLNHITRNFHRVSNGFSYEDPPIFINLPHKMKEYSGLVFNYENGYYRKLFNLGMNSVTAHLKTEFEEIEFPINVYIGRREMGCPVDGNYILQDAYYAIRPPFDNQNYQHRYGNTPHHTNNGRGQYVQQILLETYYQSVHNNPTSATNIFSGNFGNPNFHYPDEETPLYCGKYDMPSGGILRMTESEDDHYYPVFSEKYFRKVHENSMRNSGYNDAEYIPYYSQYALWYELPENVIQGAQTDGPGVPKFIEDWIIVYDYKEYWDYNYKTTMNTEKEFVLDLFANFDKERDAIHCDNVRHNKAHVTLWQSQEPREGFIRHQDQETGVYYSVKIRTEKPERQFVPWKLFGDGRWKLVQTPMVDEWWNHVNKPFRVPYSIFGRIETNTGIDTEDRVLHHGNYWVCITPKMNYMGAVLIAGTKEEIEARVSEDSDTSLVLDPDHYQTGVYHTDHWEYTDIQLTDCMTYSVLEVLSTGLSANLFCIHGKFQEYEDAENRFSPDGDRFELYAETGLYYIFTAYERGIVESLHSYSMPVVQCHELSYLFGTDYSKTLFIPVYDEKLYAGNPYFYEGYQMFHAQIVDTNNDEIQWIPVWVYIGDGTPPYNEDEPDLTWRLLDQKYINRDGEEKPAYVAYHKEQFPVDIPYKIKESHHTYFDKTKDIYYTCIVTSRHEKYHEMSVYPTPQYSVHELSFGMKYTDIQHRIRITGPNGHYKAMIHLTPEEVSTSTEMILHPTVTFNQVTTEDRINIRATRNDGSTYDIPLFNVPSLNHPLETVSQTADQSVIQYNGLKHGNTKWTFMQNPYPKNTVFAMRSIPENGVIDLNHPYLKRRWLRSPLDSDRYEILVNGKVLTHNDQYTIITPTKIVLHGMTSLHNLEINEINREPSKEFFHPRDMTSTIDKILEGTLVDGTYQNEFTHEEQSSFLPEGVYPQVGLNDTLYPFYPMNVDMDPDIRAIPNDTPEEMLETDYQWLVDMPFLEGAPIVTNVHIGEYPLYPAAGMDVRPMTNYSISKAFRKGFTERVDDGRHIVPDSPMKDQIHIMWDPVAQSEQKWQVPYLMNKTYTTNYLLDPRYRDYFPTEELLGKPNDVLYHDPSIPVLPPLLERDWVRYRATRPNTPIRDTFHVIWDTSSHNDDEWALSTNDPQLFHGGRFNWKGWQKPDPTDKFHYALWKMNSNANPEKPWEKQKHESVYEPNMVYVEQDPKHYFSYLGDYIKSHYESFIDSSIGSFRGFNGWYPWKNPDAPYIKNQQYWDTDRIMGKVGGLNQSPYGVQVNNNPNRIGSEVFKYEYLDDSTIRLWFDGVYEGEYAEARMNGINSIRLLMYDASTDKLVRDIVLPVDQPRYVDIPDLESNTVYDLYFDFANRAGIRHGKKFKIDSMFR